MKSTKQKNSLCEPYHTLIMLREKSMWNPKTTLAHEEFESDTVEAPYIQTV